MPLYLKIATVNCRVIRDRAKRLVFFTYAKTPDVHVLCLQETFSNPKMNLFGKLIGEISRKTDAGMAILAAKPSQFTIRLY